MGKGIPLVSIGMLVFNAKRFLADSIEALLAQDFTDFELIISDNASSDGSTDICREYAAKDARISLIVQERNLGAIRNFDFALRAARGKYFMWAADHDLWKPNWVSRCVALLEQDPEMALAYSHTLVIDEEGGPMGIAPDRLDTRGLPPAERYRRVVRDVVWCNAIYGMFRRDVLSEAVSVPNTAFGGDHIMLAEAALEGTFAQIDEPLYLRRWHRAEETQTARKERMLEMIDPTTVSVRKRSSFPKLYRELRDGHLDMLASVPMPFRDRLLLTIETLEAFQARYQV